MTTAVTATGAGLRDDHGNDDWPGIISRFQLVFLAGRRSKQLFKGAHPRIPADPLKRRNTSIALEELRRGLIPFQTKNVNASQTSPTAIDTVGNSSEVKHLTNFDLRSAEQSNESG
jgi:DNA-directed RNA polymerase omega subunit